MPFQNILGNIGDLFQESDEDKRRREEQQKQFKRQTDALFQKGKQVISQIAKTPEEASKIFESAKKQTVKSLNIPVKSQIPKGEAVGARVLKGMQAPTFGTYKETGPEQFGEFLTYGTPMGAISTSGIALAGLGLKFAGKAPKIAKTLKVAPKVSEVLPTVKKVTGKISIPKFAANINLDKLDAPSEVKQIITQISEENKGLIEAQRRGRISTKNFVAEDLATKTGMSLDKFLNTKPGKAMNAEELKVLDSLMLKKMDDLKTFSDSIKSGNVTSENQLVFWKTLNEAIQLESVAAGGRAEAGRSLESLKHIRTALTSLDSIQMAKVIKSLGGREITEELAGKIAKLDYSNPADVFNFIKNIYRPNVRQYIDSLFFNSILSGPSTHMINFISNTAFNLTNNLVVRPTRALLDIPISKLQGRQREYYFKEIIPSITGAITGIPLGARRAINMTIRGFDATDIVERSKVERIFRGETFKGGLSFINLPSRLLRSADLFAKSTAYSAELSAQAAKQATKEGLKGIAFSERMTELMQTPSLNMLKAAGDFADYVTFTTKPDKFTSSVIKMRDAVPGLEFVIPFISTPSNLFKAGIEFSPLSPLVGGIRKGPQLTDQMAKMIIGSSIASAFAWLFWDGKMTGGVPQSPSERDRFYREGKLPYSVKIGDQWVQYQRLDPLNTPLTMIAGIYDEFVVNKKAPLQQKVMGVIGNLAQNVTSQTWLRGISDLLDAIQEPERKLEYYLSTRATAVVPNVVAQLTRAQDKYIRKPAGITEQILARIPGLAQRVPPRLDVFGKPIERKGPFKEIFPIKFSEEITDRVDQELSRLDANIGFPSKSVTTPGKKEFKLTREGQYIYTQLSGQLIKRRLNKALDNPQWQTISDDDKRKVIKRISTQEREKARNIIISILKKEQSGKPMSVIDINNRFREIGADLEISELPTPGELKLGEMTKTEG